MGLFKWYLVDYTLKSQCKRAVKTICKGAKIIGQLSALHVSLFVLLVAAAVVGLGFPITILLWPLSDAKYAGDDKYPRILGASGLGFVMLSCLQIFALCLSCSVGQVLS